MQTKSSQIIHLGYKTKRALTKTGLYLLALPLVIVALGLTTPPAQAANCTQNHTIQPGETLYRIGLRYGLTWDKLMEINDIADPDLIYWGQKLCVSVNHWLPPAPGPVVNPTFRILSVTRNQTVTIQTNNFPANDAFTVRFAVMGTRGVNGIVADSITSGEGGSSQLTFNIPAALRGSYQIAIRLESPTSGYYAYNWFYNHTTR